MHPKKLAGEGCGPRSAKRVDAPFDRNLAFSERVGDQFGGEGLLKVTPTLERQFIGTGIGSERPHCAILRPVLKRYVHQNIP